MTAGRRKDKDCGYLRSATGDPGQGTHLFPSRGLVTYSCLQNVALINELMASVEFAGQNKQVVYHYEKGLYQVVL